MRSISDNGVLLAILSNEEEAKEKYNYIGDGEKALQVGFINLGREHQPYAHFHNKREFRFNIRPVELFFMLSGKMEICLFGNDKRFVERVVMGKGDIVILYDGGHGVKTLEDGTKFLEVKFGNYVSPEVDKTRFKTDVFK